MARWQKPPPQILQIARSSAQNNTRGRRFPPRPASAVLMLAQRSAVLLVLPLVLLCTFGSGAHNSTPCRDDAVHLPWAEDFVRRMAAAHGDLFTDESRQHLVHGREAESGYWADRSMCWTPRPGRALGRYAAGYTGKMSLLRAQHYCAHLRGACAGVMCDDGSTAGCTVHAGVAPPPSSPLPPPPPPPPSPRPPPQLPDHHPPSEEGEQEADVTEAADAKGRIAFVKNCSGAERRLGRAYPCPVGQFLSVTAATTIAAATTTTPAAMECRPCRLPETHHQLHQRRQRQHQRQQHHRNQRGAFSDLSGGGGATDAPASFVSHGGVVIADGGAADDDGGGVYCAWAFPTVTTEGDLFVGGLYRGGGGGGDRNRTEAAGGDSSQAGGSGKTEHPGTPKSNESSSYVPTVALVIGAMKGGTMTLWQALGSHPHVFRTLKEPHYFDTGYDTQTPGE
jgi:hypothetical protein